MPNLMQDKLKDVIDRTAQEINTLYDYVDGRSVTKEAVEAGID